MDIATLFVRFKADTSDVDKSVRQMEANTTRSGQNISSTLAKAFAAGAVIAGIGKTISAASDLNETVSKTEVVFGNASAAVIKTGESAAKSMGLSKTAYLDAASSLKGLLDNMGLTADKSVQWSQDLVRLGSDLGSFFNKDPAEAVAAIGSALRGETEPIRAFNVQISQAAVVQKALELGLISSASEMNNSAKAQATLALIMEQTTTAQGDFARTADGAANSQRILKADMENAAASIGQALLPTFTQLVQFVSRAAEIFAGLPAPVQAAVVGMLGFVALAGPLSKVIEVVGGIQKALIGLGSAAGPVGLAIVAVGYLAAAMSVHDDSAKQVAARAKEVASNLDEETASIIKQRLAADDATTATQSYADAQTALSAALTGGDEKGQAMAKALGALGFQASDAARFVELLSSSSLILADRTELTGDAAYDAALANRALFEQMLAGKGIAKDVADVLFEAGTGASSFGGEADVTKAKVKGWTDENKALVSAIIEVGKQTKDIDTAQISTDYLNAEVASSKFRASLVAQAESQAGATRNGEDALAVYEAYVRILENLTPEQQAQLEVTGEQAAANTTLATSVDTAAEATKRLKEEQDRNKDATKNLSDAISGSQSHFDDLADAADGLYDALRKVLGIGLDAEEANQGYEESIDKVTESIKTNKATLDIQTEAGRANRSAIKDSVEAILEKIKADIASGVATEDATRAGLLYRDALIDTAVQSGLSREAAEAYVNQLGLTPENVTTAVNLENDEEMKVKLQGLLTQLGDIDAGAAAEIQALIDEGSFAEAAYRLKILTQSRTITIRTQLNDRGGPLLPPEIDNSKGTSTGTGSAIATAFGGPSSPGGVATSVPFSTSTSTSSVGVHVDHLEVHSDNGLAALAQMANLVMAGVP